MKKSKLPLYYMDEPKARFISEQAKEYLDKTLYVSDQLENKATILLGFTITIMIGVIAYFVSNYSVLKWLSIPLSVYLIELLVCSVFLFLALIPANYWSSGSDPQRLLKTTEKDEDIVDFILAEALSYHSRIDNNIKNNLEKAGKVKAGIYIFMFAPILAAFVAILFSTFCYI